MSTSTFPILELGQQVRTPQGAGRVVGVALVGGVYHDGTHQELEPPVVTVQLTSTGETTQCCLCKLQLADKQAQALLRAEFHRLWPPVETEPVQLQPEARSILKARTAEQLGRVVGSETKARQLVKACFTTLIIEDPSQRDRYESHEADVLSALEHHFSRGG